MLDLDLQETAVNKPDPATTTLHIRTMNAYETQVWLYDLSGRLVEAKAVRDREGSIDISKMKSGLNLLKISFGNDSIHYEKVVTQ